MMSPLDAALSRLISSTRPPLASAAFSHLDSWIVRENATLGVSFTFRAKSSAVSGLATLSGHAGIKPSASTRPSTMQSTGSMNAHVLFQSLIPIPNHPIHFALRAGDEAVDGHRHLQFELSRVLILWPARRAGPADLLLLTRRTELPEIDMNYCGCLSRTPTRIRSSLHRKFPFAVGLYEVGKANPSISVHSGTNRQSGCSSCRAVEHRRGGPPKELCRKCSPPPRTDIRPVGPAPTIKICVVVTGWYEACSHLL